MFKRIFNKDNAPITKAEADAKAKNKEKYRVLFCQKCHKSGGTLTKIGDGYQHISCKNPLLSQKDLEKVKKEISKLEKVSKVLKKVGIESNK